MPTTTRSATTASARRAKFDSSLGTARDTGTRADNRVTYLTPGNLGGLYAHACRWPPARHGGQRSTSAAASATPRARWTCRPPTRRPTSRPWPARTSSRPPTSAPPTLRHRQGALLLSPVEDRQQQGWVSTASALVPVGAAGQLRLGYTPNASRARTRPARASSANDCQPVRARLLLAQPVKRTALYGGGYVKNKGAATFCQCDHAGVAWWPDRSPGLRTSLPAPRLRSRQAMGGLQIRNRPANPLVAAGRPRTRRTTTDIQFAGAGAPGRLNGSLKRAAASLLGVDGFPSTPAGSIT